MINTYRRLIDELIRKSRTKSRFYTKLGVLLALFIVLISLFSFKKIRSGGQLSFSLAASVIYLAALIVHVIVVQVRGVPIIFHDQLPVPDKEGKEYFIFLRTHDAKLAEISDMFNVAKLKIAVSENVLVPSVCDFRQNTGLVSSKPIYLICHDLHNRVLESREQLFGIRGSGLCLWIRDSREFDEVIKSHLHCNIIDMEIKNRTAVLRCSGYRAIKGKESLKSYLLCINDTPRPHVSRYDKLLLRFLLRCPDDEESVYPVCERAENQGRKFWIDGYDAQLAIRLLRMFDSEEMLVDPILCEIMLPKFLQKVGYVLNYIAQKNIKPHESDTDEIFKVARCVFHYDMFDYNVRLNSDVRLRVRDVMREDLEENEIYKYIFSVASYPYELDRSKNANFKALYKLFKTEGFEDVMCKIKVTLDNYLNKKIAVGSYVYERLRIGEMSEKMLEEGVIEKDASREYTGIELIGLVRTMIYSRYMKLGLIREEHQSFVTEIKCGLSIVLMKDDRVSEVSDDVSDDVSEPEMTSGYQMGNMCSVS
ncbi:MAG: hypothetical protein ACTJLM_04980 [Ehrlichia sp.]